MASYSRITLIGNVGQEPQQKQAGSQSVVETSLAVNTKRGDQEFTNWYRLSFWGRQGETAQQYVRKGEQLFVEGRLLVREFTKADGAIGYSLEVTVSDFQLISGKGQTEGGAPAASYGSGSSSSSSSGSGSGYAQAPGRAAEPTAPEPIRPVGAAAAPDDDLPF